MHIEMLGSHLRLTGLYDNVTEEARRAQTSKSLAVAFEAFGIEKVAKAENIALLLIIKRSGWNKVSNCGNRKTRRVLQQKQNGEN